MLFIALLASDAEACAMSYGGSYGTFAGAGSYSGVTITSSLEEALAAIELTPAERFESLAPKIEDKAPDTPPERPRPTT